MRPFKLLAALATLLVFAASCKTTNNTGGYDYNKSHAAYGSDGGPYRDPGQVQRVKNAMNAFQL